MVESLAHREWSNKDTKERSREMDMAVTDASSHHFPVDQSLEAKHN